MIIYFSSGGKWYVGPLIFLVSLFLDGRTFQYILDVVCDAIRWSLGFNLGSRSHAQLTPIEAGPRLMAIGIAIYGAYRLFQNLKALWRSVNTGGWQSLPLLASIPWAAFGLGNPTAQHGFGGFGGFGHPGGPAGGGGGGARRQRAAAAPRATIEQVAEVLQGLPTELHATRADLEHMTVHELKERCVARGLEPAIFLEKAELIQQLAQPANSSAATCAVCAEDYGSGDALRVLPCGHRFHIECIDKWLLACDFSRPPACPMCNAELLKQR